MSRDSFLAKVRQAAASGRRYRVAVRSGLPADVGYVGGGDNPVQQFASEIALLGGKSHIASDLADARAFTAEVIREAATTTALCWRHPVLDRFDLYSQLREQNVEPWDHERLSALSPTEQRRIIFACGLGVTSVFAAVAETGSTVVAAAPGAERFASLAPPVHLAIVSREQIVGDVLDVFKQLAAQGLDALPSNVAFITGPSKTGDIEMNLVTGVHGPGAWRVLILPE